MNSESPQLAGQPTITKPRSVVFANSKGGVGKSTLALMASLGLATLHPNSRVELIDLDVQKTSSGSLRRFENTRFSVLENEDFFLNSGSPNNGNLINHMGSDFPYSSNLCYRGGRQAEVKSACFAGETKSLLSAGVSPFPIS